MEPTEIRKSIKHKPPVIRQTLTSIYRIAKANPLLFVDDLARVTNGPRSIDLNKSKLPNSLKPVTKNLTETMFKMEAKPVLKTKPTPKPFKPQLTKNVIGNNNKVTNTKRQTLIQTKPKPNLTKPQSTVRTTQQKVNNNRATIRRSFSSDNLEARKKPRQPVVKFVETTPARKKVKSRRSLSAEHFDRKKSSGLNPIQSLPNIQNPDDNMIRIEERRVTFITPDHGNRGSSITVVPTPFVRKHSTPFIIKTNYQLSDLHARLKEWLKLHKKPSSSYQCLESFGSESENGGYEENKENIESDNPISSSYEDLRIISSVTSRKDPDNRTDLVQGTLKDLYRLISEGFSVEQSEAWLNVISQKYVYLESEPQYWECRAAIEQNRGNITCAVDCLKTAIVQGAEVQSVDRSLEQLLHKFSLLNINTPCSTDFEEGSIKNDRARIVKDARSVFKSSIIQFAIQERNIKKNTIESDCEKKFIATPVRRSTRLTPSKYRFTPKVQILSTLQDLGDDVRSNMDFYSNNQLKVRFSSVKKKKD